MRLIFVNRFYLPDGSATAQMLGDLVGAMADLPFERLVIASRSQYTDTGQDLPARGPNDGVFVHRLFSLRNPRRTLPQRFLNFLIFYVLAFVATLKLARQGDVIVCLTDPPLGCVAIGLAARIRHARVINWVQDIYPETAHRLGYSICSGMISSRVARLRDRCWQRSAANVAIGDTMADYLAERGVERSRIATIPNWADENDLLPLAKDRNHLRKAWHVSDKECLVGYSGNLGRAHDADTMIGAIREVGRDPKSTLRFLFIGGGVKLAAVRQIQPELRQGRVMFRSYQPRERLCESLAAPDIHWLSLNPVLEGLIVPSKFYSAAAVGRPIVFVGAPDGEIARLIAEGECGRSFAPGQSHELAAYLRELEADEDFRRRLGSNARAFSVEVLNRGQRHREWQRLIGEVGGLGSLQPAWPDDLRQAAE